MYRFIISFIGIISLLLTGCGRKSDQQQKSLSKWMEPNGKLKVLSTIAMIDDLVKEIGGEHVDSITLVKGDLDPHSYQLVKGDDEKLAYATVIFYNGLGLEHGPSLRHHLHDSTKAVAIGDTIVKNDPNILLYVDGQMDPHIWMDVSIWSKGIPIIVKALSQADPEHANFYIANGEKLQKELIQTHEQMRKVLHEIPEEKRYLVTSHDAFNYFTRAYLAADNENGIEGWGKRFAAPEGLAPESQLSTTDIQKIIKHMNEYNIHVLFPESNVSKDSIRKIVQAGNESGLHLVISETTLYGDAMGAPGSDGENYPKMMMHNANTIAQHWK
jgi:manganese/zinc/iron transport system substrate-binding protein